MAQLLNNYSLHEIFTFLIILALGIKGFFTFWDWAAERLRKIFHKENQQDLDREKIQQLTEKQGKLIEDVNKVLLDREKFNQLSENQEKLIDDMSKLTDKIDMLIESDKADIKAYITEKHHYFVYDKKWIDDHSLDSLEKRFKHYVEEGGNSFVSGLMSEIRQLPKVPPRT